MENPMIFKAISNTMKDIGVVGKNDFNTYDKYTFRGIDAVMNALNPAMIKNGIFVIPEVLDCHREEREGKTQTMMYTVLTVRYTFYAADGSNVSATVMGEAMDRSDKSTNKAMSAAFKYACFQTFCIPTEELLEDADKDSLEIGRKTTQNAAAASQIGNPTAEQKKAPKTPENGHNPYAIVGNKELRVLETLCNKLGYDLAETFPTWPNIPVGKYDEAYAKLRKNLAQLEKLRGAS